jgi:hypothetical protein
MMSTARQDWATAFYWIGVTTALACLVLVFAGNTEFAWRFEHSGFPLSWALAGSAVLAFLAFELCEYGPSVPSEAAAPSSQLYPEWKALET